LLVLQEEKREEKRAFKEQLLEFIEEQTEPFNLDFLVERCLQPVSRITVHDVLCELIVEGKVIALGNGLYLSTRVLMRKWIREKIPEEIIPEKENLVELPDGMMGEIEEVLRMRQLGYMDVEEFVRDAIRRYLSEICL